MTCCPHKPSCDLLSTKPHPNLHDLLSTKTCHYSLPTAVLVIVCHPPKPTHAPKADYPPKFIIITHCPPQPLILTANTVQLVILFGVSSWTYSPLFPLPFKLLIKLTVYSMYAALFQPFLCVETMQKYNYMHIGYVTLSHSLLSVSLKSIMYHASHFKVFRGGSMHTYDTILHL